MVARLVPLGVKTIQLRIKHQPEEFVRAEVQAALAACDEHHAQLILNDYWEIAIDEGIGFVHLGQEDLDEADIFALRAAGISIGVSTHDELELDRALAIVPEYIALGPIYPTASKAMHWEPQGLEAITQWKEAIGNIPLIAIGGLTIDRAADVLAAGADCLAVASDIALHPNPEAQTLKWLEMLKGV